MLKLGPGHGFGGLPWRPQARAQLLPAVLVDAPMLLRVSRNRKAALEALLARGKDDEAAEDAILERAKVIEAKRKAEASARKPPPVGEIVLKH